MALSLPHMPDVFGRLFKIGAERVDIEASSFCVASIDGEFFGEASGEDIVKHLFYAIFGKAGMPSKRNNIF